MTNTKAYRGMGMEGFIAKWYTSTTSKSLREFQLLARRIADELRPQSRVLEVAPGPGFFAIELAKLGVFEITGLDISRTFVEIAQKSAAAAGVSAAFRHGNVSAMPFPGDRFDFLLCRAAFKNFSQPVEALKEMYRVLAPGGRALIIDLRRDSSNESIRRDVDAMGLNWMNALIVRLTFRFMLLKRAYTRADFERMIAQTGFRKSEIRESNTGLEIELFK